MNMLCTILFFFNRLVNKSVHYRRLLQHGCILANLNCISQYFYITIDNMNAVIEAVGYTGSLLIVISMLMTSVKKLRIVNTAGSIIFTTYALIIKSYPTALMNLCLIIINFVNIYRLYKAGKTYTVIECYKKESIVQLYLKQNLPDIKKFFPDFSPEAAGNSYSPRIP